MDILALIISACALCLSIFQFFSDGERQKKESTLLAYNELQNEVFSKLKQYNLKALGQETEEWNQVTTCLAKIENFCVGINSGIYSLDTLNRLGGGFFIGQFDTLWPIINRKRDGDPRSKHYDEFESVIKKLKIKREKREWRSEN